MFDCFMGVAKVFEEEFSLYASDKKWFWDNMLDITYSIEPGFVAGTKSAYVCFVDAAEIFR
jgi:hypothetical protein